MRCRFVRKIYHNEQNGYTVAVYSTDDKSVPIAARDKSLSSYRVIGFTATGFGLPLTNTIEVEMEGTWQKDKHGFQCKVDHFMEIVPRTKEGIIGYLSSGAIKGVKEKTAEAIYQKFGLQTLEVIENTPEKLLCVRGITERKLKYIKEGFSQNKSFRELMTFLAPYHITPKKVHKILETFHEDSLNIIRKHPYMLCSVKGFGFLTVDAIGRQLCSSPCDPMRISSCISYILHEVMKEGHLYAEKDSLIQKVLEVLNKDIIPPAVSELHVNQVLYRLIMQKAIVLDGEYVYIQKVYEQENQAASLIAKRLLLNQKPLDVESELALAQKSLKITLSERQKKAVRMVFQNPISIITGGPGTGKTTVLKVILYIHNLKCRTEVQLMAPTGRAARRMSESTGNPNATTMHMALGILGDSTDYELDFSYLNAAFLNVDEMSMVDMHMAYEFFRRVRGDARILFLGDVNQLPSVGAGDVFRQLIGCGLIPVTVLDMVYRQGINSNIPVNAQLIQNNQTQLCMGEDFVFLPCKGAEEAAEIVKKLYLNEVSERGINEVQILTPYRVRTAAGVKELNQTLEDLISPPEKSRKELSVGKETFRVGDKVLQNKNTEFANNGDMGIIEEIYKDEDGNDLIQIRYADNRKVEYEIEEMEMIEHANAITIHKSQGSECPVVIIPWVKAFYMMLKRNILYTAITRAKEKVYLVGEWSAVCQAIHTDDTGKRNTVLGERIIHYYHQYQSKTVPDMGQMKLAV